mmetsp:Transcript_16672/g.23603  ORF Transcript_16672/g.23603 Transcript_16672/m.23603 type:complete len:308 (-) Transcript_16672:3-926(-)
MHCQFNSQKSKSGGRMDKFTSAIAKSADLQEAFLQPKFLAMINKLFTASLVAFLSTQSLCFKIGLIKPKFAKALFSQYDQGVDFAGGLIGSDIEIPQFDPLNLSEGKSEAQLKYYREAEITHGRVSMLAVLGWVVPDTKTTLGTSQNNPLTSAIFGKESIDFSLELLRDPIQAAKAIGPQFFIELMVISGIVEAIRYNRILKSGSNIEPGDLSLDPFGLTVPATEEMMKLGNWEGKEPKFRGERFGPNAIESRVFGLMPSGVRKLKVSELKHGRLAMLSILGLILQEIVTGQSLMIQMQGYGFNAFR